MRKLSQSGPIWGQKLQQWRSQRAHTYFLCACWLYAVPRSQNGSQNDPRIDSKRVPTSMFFRNIFVHFFIMFMFNLASRPGRLLFSFVVKSNNNKKDRQGKATQEKTQDQTSPRQDQTDIPHLQQRGRVPKRNRDAFWRLSEFLRWNRCQNGKKTPADFEVAQQHER